MESEDEDKSLGCWIGGEALVICYVILREGEQNKCSIFLSDLSVESVLCLWSTCEKYGAMCAENLSDHGRRTAQVHRS